MSTTIPPTTAAVSTTRIYTTSTPSRRAGVASNAVEIHSFYTRLLRQQYRWLREDGISASQARAALTTALLVGTWGGTFIPRKQVAA